MVHAFIFCKMLDERALQCLFQSVPSYVGLSFFMMGLFFIIYHEHFGVMFLYVSAGCLVWVMFWWICRPQFSICRTLLERQAQQPRPPALRPYNPREVLQLCNQRFSVYLPLEIVELIVQSF